MRAFFFPTQKKKSNVTLFEYVLLITMMVPIARAGASTILDRMQ